MRKSKLMFMFIYLFLSKFIVRPNCNSYIRLLKHESWKTYMIFEFQEPYRIILRKKKKKKPWGSAVYPSLPSQIVPGGGDPIDNFIEKSTPFKVYSIEKKYKTYTSLSFLTLCSYLNALTISGLWNNLNYSL